MNELQKTVVNGLQLKAARIIAGLTIRELALEAKVSRNTITRVERISTLPLHAIAADRMARALQERGITFTASGGMVGVSFQAPDTRKRKIPL